MSNTNDFVVNENNCMQCKKIKWIPAAYTQYAHKEKQQKQPHEYGHRTLQAYWDGCFKSGSISNKRWWQDSPQPSCNLINNNPPLSAMCIFHAQMELHTFFLTMLLQYPPFLPLTFNLKVKFPSRYITIQYQFAIATWSIFSLKPTSTSNSWIFFYLSAVLHTLLSPWISLSLKFPFCFLSRHIASLQYSIAGHT